MSDVAICRRYPSAADRSFFVRSERLLSYWPEALASAVALAVAAAILAIDPCPDVAWQLWIGHQLRYGARFYIDIIETNPPLWFWLAIPMDWIAELIGVRTAAVMVAAVAAASAFAVVAVGRLSVGLHPRVRAAFLLCVAFTLMLMPLLDTGQREQILLIGAVPYVVLAGCRHEARSVSPAFAAAIGVFGAVGFALKHYFLIAPGLIELWLFLTLRRRYQPVRPETIAMVAVGGLYAVAALSLTPAYFHDILPMLRLSYGSLKVRHVGDMIEVNQIYWAAAGALLLYRFDLLVRTPRSMAFAIAAIGFAAAWLIQFKGWHNHELPVTGCLMLAVSALIAEHWRDLQSPVWVVAPIFLMMPCLHAMSVTPYHDPLAPLTRPMLAGLREKDSVAFVSEHSQYAWPLTLNRGYFYPSRHYGMWMMTGLFGHGAKDPAMVSLARRVVDETAQDYSCAQPVRIIFDQHDRGGFDMEGFFLESRRFASLMRHYRLSARYDHFDIYQRSKPFMSPSPADCRRAV